MAAFLHRFAGAPASTPPVTATFADRAVGSAFFREIEWLAAEGISTGSLYPDGRRLFLGDDAVTRQAMAAFLYRFAGSPAFSPPTTPTFVDVPAGSPFSAEVEWLASTGITTGTLLGNGTRAFEPAEPVTRQAMAAFLHRLAVHLD
jgi:hypothetical protein